MIISTLVNRMNFFRKKVKYKVFPHINGYIRLHGDGQLIIGANVRINSREKSNPIGGMDYSIFAVYGTGKIIIGNNVGISNSALVARNSITIGDGVKIGGSVKIYDTDFHSKNPLERRDGVKDVAKTSPIFIKENAFIGAHSIILKGVTIGENSIIGAGSVVTKNIPSNEIWAGNPAKFIKKIGDNDENIMDV